MPIWIWLDMSGSDSIEVLMELGSLLFVLDLISWIENESDLISYLL